MNLSKQKPLFFFFLVFFFLHTHTRVRMFLVNLLQCSGHSLSGPWGCECLVKSVVMKPPMRKPRGQISLCALPRPHIWAQWEPSLYKFCRKGSRLWWGLWVPGHSLFLPLCVPLSVNELMAVGLLGAIPHKQRLQELPWRLTGELPPERRDRAQPHSSGCRAPHITQKAPCRWGRPHSFMLGVYRCFPLGNFYLLNTKVDVYCAFFVIEHNFTDVKS